MFLRPLLLMVCAVALAGPTKASERVAGIDPIAENAHAVIVALDWNDDRVTLTDSQGNEWCYRTYPSWGIVWKSVQTQPTDGSPGDDSRTWVIDSNTVVEALWSGTPVAVIERLSGGQHPTPEERERAKRPPPITMGAWKSPTTAVGIGWGLPYMIHFNARVWTVPWVSLDLSVTPLLLINQGQVGLTLHVPVGESTNAQKHLLVSGVVGGAALYCCGATAGAGGLVGYSTRGEKSGLSFTLGALMVQPIYGVEGGVILDARMTTWFLRR